MNNPKKICLNCGKEIDGRNKKFCDQSCRTMYLQQRRICVVCGKEFLVPPSSGKITCSTVCEKANRAKNGLSGENMNKLKLAHEAAAKSPNSSSCETNSRAKSWVIQSPEGTIYEVNNITLWARQNADILPSDPGKFSSGIIAIKGTIEGKKKRGSYQYRGWHLISYSEKNNARSELPEPKKRVPRKKMSEEERLEKKRERAREHYKNKKEINH